MTRPYETVALQIRAGKSDIWVKPKNGKRFSLEELQSFVGGNIEIIACPHGQIMIVNEEGRLKELPVNRVASKVAQREVVGDVLLTDVRLIK